MSKEYDKIFKENFESIYLSLSEKVLKFKPEKVADISLDLQRTIERQPDFLKKVRDPLTGEIYILHIEIQTFDNAEMVYRMYEYRGLIVRKFKLKVRQMVIYTGIGHSKMQNTLEDGANKFHYELLNIQSISYRSFLESDKPEELLLSILGNLEKDSAAKVLEKIFTKAKDVVNETFSMEKFVTQLEAFAKLRNYIEPFKLISKKIMLIEIDPKDTFLYKMGKESGEKAGEKRGVKKKQDDMILSLLKKGKFTLKDIAEAAGVSLSYVSRLKKKAGI
jgi:DNA-binding MarR family transcriptional regulator